ncbi:MAG: uroporphyrinogen decarboxylase family protein [Anaerolineae bacterium]
MTTGREKILAALSPNGSGEVPAVICYEDIFYRDHWRQFTACPWWYALESSAARQLAWRKDAIESIGQDWYVLPMGASRDERAKLAFEERPDGVYRVDRHLGRATRLQEPPVGGQYIRMTGGQAPIANRADLDRLIPAARQQIFCGSMDGRRDLADSLLHGPGANLAPLMHIPSPLWSCAMTWGFEDFMLALADRPELVRYACERYSLLAEQQAAEAAALGAEVIWIEECMTDMVSPADFKEFNLPYATRVVEAIRDAGMQSIYYYCGSPAGRLEFILEAGADAISLEESKKGFDIDIEDIVEAVDGRCAVLGNLDAINLLPACSEAQLRAEITRQITAGRRNKSRFIMSLGSPVTPGTTVQRVRLYCDLVHELGNG